MKKYYMLPVMFLILGACGPHRDLVGRDGTAWGPGGLSL
jgi:hypothetical protein